MANATALTGRSGIQIVIDSSKTDTAKLAPATDKLSVNERIDWAFGTSTDQANLLYHASLTATNSQATVDISGTSIQDVHGDDCDFSILKLVYVKNTDETEDLILGGDTNEIDIFKDTTDELLIKPGGSFLWQDPIGIDVTTNKNLTIQAETAHVTYDLVLMGEKT